MKRLILALVAIFATSGCANYASFQSADTVPEGQGVAGIGMTYSGYEAEVGDQTESFSVPALNLWYRRGITEEFEVHGNIWIPFGASLGAKYQLLGGRKTPGLSLSLGADLGYLSITTGSGDTEASASVLDVYIPVYTGYRVSEGFAVYFTPKYILRAAFASASSGSAEASDNELYHTPGATIGVAIGSDIEFLIEGTVAYDLTNEYAAYTAGIGIGF